MVPEGLEAPGACANTAPCSLHRFQQQLQRRRGKQRHPWLKYFTLKLSLPTVFPVNSRDCRVNRSGRRPAEQTCSGVRFTHNNCDSPDLKSIQMSACSALLGLRCRANASESLLRCCPTRIFLAAAVSQLCASLWYWEAGEGCLVTKYLACSLFSRFWPSLNTLLWGERRWIGAARLSTWKWEKRTQCIQVSVLFSSICLIFFISQPLFFPSALQ